MQGANATIRHSDNYTTGVTKMKHRKTIKSFKQLGEINVRSLYGKNGKLKKLDKKFAISFARQIADGFDDDLRKPVSDKLYRKARKFIDGYIAASSGEKTKIVRPSRENRLLYARYADLDPTFKVFAIPVLDKDDTFDTIKVNGKKRLRRKGKFSRSVAFDFESQTRLIKNTKAETEKLFKEIDKKFGKGKYAIKIRCGEHEYKTLYHTRDPYLEIENWITAYGAPRVKKFCLGFQVYTFSGQEKFGTPLAKKGDKKKRKSKRDKVRFK